jgi:hypothetical protein
VNRIAFELENTQGGKCDEYGLWEVREIGVRGANQSSNRVVQEVPAGEMPEVRDEPLGQLLEPLLFQMQLQPGADGEQTCDCGFSDDCGVYFNPMEGCEMNLNKLAKEICSLEGGKQNLSIAQVKEVLKQLGVVLYTMHATEAVEVFQRLMKSK